MKKLFTITAAVCALAVFTSGVAVHAQLPVSDGLQFHLDASSITGLEKGDSVAAWADLANAKNVTQTDGGKQPTYVPSAPSLNNMPAVYFDGGDYLTNEGWNLITGAAPRTMIAVWADAVDINLNNQHAVGFGTFARNEFYSIVPYNGGGAANSANKKIGWHNHGNSGATYIEGGSNANMGMNYYNGTTDCITANGLLGKVNTIALDSTVSRLTVGAHTNNGEPMEGNIAEVLIYDRALTTKEQQQVGSYLTEKYNLNTTYLAPGTQNVSQTFSGQDSDTKYATVYIGREGNDGYNTSTPKASATNCGLMDDGTFRLLSNSNTSDDGNTNKYMKNTLYFNNEGYGSNYISASFDIRMTGGADGVNFSLINTDTLDPSTAFSVDHPEGTGLKNSLSLAFKAHGGYATKLMWNNETVGTAVDTNFFGNEFYTVNVSVNYTDDGAYFTAIAFNNDASYVIADGFKAGVTPYNNSVMFSGRTGGTTMIADLDNISVVYNNDAPITQRWIPGKSGNFNDAANWENNTVPANVTAQIYGGTNSITGGNVENGVNLLVTGGKTSTTGAFHVANAADSTGSMTMEAGEFVINGKAVIAAGAGSEGSLTINGGHYKVSRSDWNVIGDHGIGSVTVNGGQYEINNTNASVVGYGADGSGTFEVNGGVVTFKQLTIGNNGNGVMDINGGRMTVNGKTVLGAGGSGDGILTVNDGHVKIAPGGSHNVIGNNGTGKVVINGGVYELSQSGDYATTLGYNGGANGTLIMNDGEASFFNIVVGRGGTGTFEMHGGTATASGYLDIASGHRSNNAGGTGTFKMTGGELDVTGALTTATATGGNATFTMSGGELTVGSFAANTAANTSAGMTLSGKAEMTVTGDFIPLQNKSGTSFDLLVTDGAVLKINGKFWGGSNDDNAANLTTDVLATYTFSGNSTTEIGGEFWVVMGGKSDVLIKDTAKVTANSRIGVGWGKSANGSRLEVAGGTLKADNFRVGEEGKGYGTAVFSGGVTNLANDMEIQHKDSVLHLTGDGVLNINKLTNKGGGTFIFDGGTLNAKEISFAVTQDGGAISPGGNGELGTTIFNDNFTSTGGAVVLDIFSETSQDSLIINDGYTWTITDDILLYINGYDGIETGDVFNFAIGDIVGAANILSASPYWLVSYDGDSGVLSVESVPEPATWLLLGLGVLAMGVFRVRRTRKA